MTNQLELVNQMSLQAWHTNVKRMHDTFEAMSDEQLMAEIAPGKNRSVYLLGHMAAVHDRMLPLLGLGERSYEHLDHAFLVSPDKTVAELPAIADLRAAWKQTNEKLAAQFALVPTDEWFTRHNSVSDEDFAKEPHRNKLSVLNSRTHHVSYHLGQLLLAKGK